MSGGADEIAQLVTALSSSGGTLWKYDTLEGGVWRGSAGNFNHAFISVTEYRAGRQRAALRQSQVFFGVLAHWRFAFVPSGADLDRL
jgi:hypothetical protein